MIHEIQSSIVQTNIHHWQVGQEKTISDLYRESAAFRQLYSSAVAGIFRHMSCIEVIEPGEDEKKRNIYKRVSLPGDVCEGCYFNTKIGKNRGSCKLKDA